MILGHVDAVHALLHVLAIVASGSLIAWLIRVAEPFYKGGRVPMPAGRKLEIAGLFSFAAPPAWYAWLFDSGAIPFNNQGLLLVMTGGFLVAMAWHMWPLFYLKRSSNRVRVRIRIRIRRRRK